MLSCAGYELRVFKCHSWKILLQNIYIVIVYYKAGEVARMGFLITQYLENIY